MTAAGCLLSAECALESTTRKGGPASYRCRAASGPCEGHVAQADETFEESCRARSGCRVKPSECFCPTAHTDVAPAPDSDEARAGASMSCACGGGPFRACVSAK